MARFPKKEAEIAALAERLWWGPLDNVATAIETEATMVDQPKGTELEYRVIAINKSGEGQPSNTVMVVL